MTEREIQVVDLLVAHNADRPDSTKCVDGVRCGTVRCTECPLNVKGTTLGEVRTMNDRKAQSVEDGGVKQPEYSGGSSDYYKVEITNTTTPFALGYTAECNDIIEALGMNFAEGNAFKAIWRRAAQRTLGKRKAGAKDDGLYDAEKVEFFGKRLVEQSKAVRDAKTK